MTQVQRRGRLTRGAMSQERSRPGSFVRPAGIDPDIRAKDLSEDQLTQLREELNKPDYVIEGDLRRDIRMNIARYAACAGCPWGLAWGSLWLGAVPASASGACWA